MNYRTRHKLANLAIIGGTVMFMVGIIAVVIIKAMNPGADESVHYARNFAAQAGWADANVSCQDYDSDGDGYVSCTVFRKGADPVAIECPALFSLNSSCRMQKAGGTWMR